MLQESDFLYLSDFVRQETEYYNEPVNSHIQFLFDLQDKIDSRIQDYTMTESLYLQKCIRANYDSIDYDTNDKIELIMLHMHLERFCNL